MRLGLAALLAWATFVVATPVGAQVADDRVLPFLDTPMVMVGGANMPDATNGEAGTFVLARKAIPAFADSASSEYVRALNGGGSKPQSRVSGILLMAVPGPILGAGVPALLVMGGLWILRRRRHAGAARR